MVTEDKLDPVIKLRPEGADPIPVEILSQGGGRRGAATAGFLCGLARFADIHVEALGGTSAGALANAVFAHGLAKEALDPSHDRQDTRRLLAKLYQVVTEYSPYNVADMMVRHAQQNIGHGRDMLNAASQAVFSPLAFAQNAARFGQAMQEQFKFCGDTLTRWARLNSMDGHILALILEDVIGSTKFINTPAAPLLVNNVVREADGAHLLLHNRQPMTLNHIAASGALTAYLSPINVPGIGLCRDGAQGGANPPLLDFYRLKEQLLPDGRARIGILYNLSDPDGSLDEELAARASKLHGDFLAAMDKQKRELAALQAEGKSIIVIQAALTRAQRQASLSDTNPAAMRAMFLTGMKQGEELGWRLLLEMYGVSRTPQHSPALATAHA